ncbi:MAG TPA: phosphotransferase [Solirubrobacterales bacterium]|nr:phosphotransferase [Solirubrobacterales bacterium]
MLAQRHSWVWSILAPDCRLVWCEGDAELAELLREAGLEVIERPFANPGAAEEASPDAVLLNAEGEAAVTGISRAAAALGPGGTVAITVGGGSPSPPRHASRPIRALQLVGSVYTAISAELAARRIARAMRRLDLEVSRVLTGERTRTRYGLGRGGWIRRVRLPVGSIMVGTVPERRGTMVEAATERAAQSLRSRLVRRSTDVFASGKLGLELGDSEGAAYYLWVAAASAREEVDRRRNAVEAIMRVNPPAPVGDRIAAPLDAGHVGPAEYVLEPKVSGAHPLRMTSRLWDDCLEFLIALHRLPRQAPALGLRGTWPDLELAADFLASHVSSGERGNLRRVYREVVHRVSDLPTGVGHGDFWRENLIVRRGSLRAVLDWEWAGKGDLPLLDYLDLVGHLGFRRSRALAPGPTFTEVLWPLVQAGGDARIQFYCAETDTPSDLRTLEGLAMAYWLLRTARAGLNLLDRLQYPGWLADNITIPLSHMREVVGTPRRASV